MGPKAPKNEFYYFMVENKKRVEKRLHRKVPLSELAGILHLEYKALSEKEKQRYTQMKNEARSCTEKLNSQGIPLSQMRRQEEEKKQKKENMIRDIKNVVDMLSSGKALHQGTFYIIAASYYVLTDDGVHVPAEVGIVQFSFEKGIIKGFQRIINPKIPSGYRCDARTNSENTHQIPLEFSEGVDNLQEVADDMYEFISKEEPSLPPLYTREEEIELTEGVLSQITDENQYRIFSLDLLFQNIYCSAFPKQMLPVSVASRMLSECGLDYHPCLACKWHEENAESAVKYCTASMVCRWVYNMCDSLHLEETFGIKPVLGKHLPLVPQGEAVAITVFDRFAEEMMNSIKEPEMVWGNPQVQPALVSSGAIPKTSPRPLSLEEFPSLPVSASKSEGLPGDSGMPRLPNVPPLNAAGVGRGRKFIHESSNN